VLRAFRSLLKGAISARTREEELAQLEMPIWMALGFEPVPELYRSWNGTWTIVPEAQSASLVPDSLPTSIEDDMDLSRFCAAPGARLSHLSLESHGAFPAQC